MARSALLVRTLTLCSIAVGALLVATSTAYAQEGARPEVATPVKAAGDLLRANKFKEALAKLRDADAIANKTPYEIYLIESTRGSAASGAGDGATAIRSFEAVINSGKAPAATQLKMVEALASSYYRAGDYPASIKWGARYFREGGTNGQIRTLMIQAYFQSGDYANAAKESLADIQADEKADRTPSEEKLQLLANSYLRQKNQGGYIATIEKLIKYYPRKSLWADIISRLQKKPGFSDRLSLDVYRLQLATGNLSSTSDFMEMTQLALQAGFSGEAKKIVDEGFSTGALGKGTDVDRQKRLRDLVEKKIAENKAMLAAGADETTAKTAKDGNDLVTLGYNMFTSGQSAKGIGLMEEGIKKNKLRRPEDAKLHLGIALIQAGQKSRGVQVLKSVQGNDGASDLANLWVLYSR
ncbi:MAG TPA: hypothetical protein VF928_05750 [Usitatibacteraceae bacterium]